jgi:hypothetical protein
MHPCGLKNEEPPSLPPPHHSTAVPDVSCPLSSIEWTRVHETSDSCSRSHMKGVRQEGSSSLATEPDCIFFRQSIKSGWWGKGGWLGEGEGGLKLRRYEPRMSQSVTIEGCVVTLTTSHKHVLPSIGTLYVQAVCLNQGKQHSLKIMTPTW